MAKQLNIDPEKTLSGGKLRPSEILIHGYNKQFKDERKFWGDSKLINLLRHMLIVREFETMLHSFYVITFEMLQFTFNVFQSII